jgi:plasmid maintenance system antidote protein VapI
VSKKKTKIEPTVSEALRKAIVDSEHSQYKLAQLTGVDSGTLSRFVNGQRSIALDTADKLCKALGLQLTKSTQEEPQ